MLKALIAEDEPWIRKGMIKMVDWERHGLELAAEAPDGEQALVLADTVQPDIILVDIRMPKCDGLELMANFKGREHRPKFIIISGYTHFESARKAISLGASAYLLKPIKKDELNKTLEEVCAAIRLERELHSEMRQAARRIRDSAPIVKEGIMLDILAGGISTNHNLREMSSFAPYYAVLVLGVDDYLLLSSNKESTDNARKVILTRTREILEHYDEGIVFERDENCYVIVLGLPSDWPSVPTSVAQRILQSMQHESFTVTIGVGKIYRDVVNLKRSFQVAKLAWREKLIAGGNTVLTAIPGRIEPPLMSEDHLAQLSMAVEISDIPEIRLRVQILLNQLVHRHEMNYEVVSRWVSRIINNAVDAAARYGVGDHFPDLSDLRYIEGLDKLAEYLTRSLIEVSGEIAVSREDAGMKAAKAAVDFIRLHYAEGITLERVAKYVHLNPNYFSEVFKREVGINFIEYLTEYRIERAKELLSQQPELNIGRISERVGYANHRYFSSLFTKRTGMKPSEYRRILPVK